MCLQLNSILLYNIYISCHLIWNLWNKPSASFINFKCKILFVMTLTHLCLASHKRDIGKQFRPRSDAAERDVWSGSTLFALIAGISIKHGNNNWPDTPLTRNGLVQSIQVEESTRHEWVKLYFMPEDVEPFFSRKHTVAADGWWRHSPVTKALCNVSPCHFYDMALSTE